MKLLTAVCSLCGHYYAHLWDDTEQADHMASVHQMRFDPEDIRKGIPPRWVELTDSTTTEF